MSVPLPLIFTSWGFRSGADWWNGAADLAVRCEGAKIPTVCVQLGTNERGEKNCLVSEAELLREAGLHVLVWGVANASDVQSELRRLKAGVEDWLPQIEGPAQRDLVLECARQGLRPSMIVTTYSGAGTDGQPDDVEKLRAAGVRTVFVEIYSAEGYPHDQVNRMLWQGTQYGWHPDELFPCLGTYRGEMPESYTGVEDVDRLFGLYLAEPMSSGQWIVWGALNPEPSTPEVDVQKVTDTQARDAVMIGAQGAIQNYDSPKPKGRNTVCWRIANADDSTWNKARDAVVKALDDAGVPQAP